MTLNVRIEGSCKCLTSPFKKPRRNTLFASVFNANIRVQSSCEKFLCFFFSEIMFLYAHPASSKRGVRVVTNVEAGCDGHDRLRVTSATDVDGEVVWSWPPGAEAKLAMLFDEHRE
jgi:hypothetical protein